LAISATQNKFRFNSLRKGRSFGVALFVDVESLRLAHPL